MMRRLIAILMVLGLALPCWGATKYVSATGNDTTGDGSEGTPYASIYKAGTVCTDATNTIWVKGAVEQAGNRFVTVAGRSYTIEGYASTTGDNGVATVTATLAYPIYDADLDATDTLWLKNLSISTSGQETTGTIYGGVNTSGTVKLTRCTLTIPATKSGPVIRYDLAAGDAHPLIALDNCTFTHSGTGTATALIRLLGGITSFTVTDCTINGNQTGVQGFELAGTITSVSMTGDNVFSTAGAVFNIGATFTSSRVVIQDAAMTSSAAGGFALDQYDVGCSFIFERNTVTAAGPCVRLGTDGADLDTVDGAPYEYTEDAVGYAPYLYVQINGNAITRTGIGAGHALMVGAAVVGGEVSYNTIAGYSGDYGFVVKGSNLNIHHNAITGRFPMLVARGSYHHIHHNTLRATGASAAFTVNVNAGAVQDHKSPDHIIVVDNILDGSGSSGTYAVSSPADAGSNYHFFSVFDRNLLIPGASGVALLNGSARGASGTNAARLAEVQAAWAESTWDDATTTGNTTNDTYSEVAASAQFYNAATGDLRIRNGSPARGTQTGTPSLGTWNDIGAWQRRSGGTNWLGM